MEPEAGLAALHRKMAKRRWVQPEYGPALLLLEDLGLLLWGFPNDPKLPGLSTVAQPEALLAVARGLDGRLGSAPADCDSTVVKYVPRQAPGDEAPAHRRQRQAHALLQQDVRARARRHRFTPSCAICGTRRRTTAERSRVPEPLAWLEREQTLLFARLCRARRRSMRCTTAR
jgi:hypothetical protein